MTGLADAVAGWAPEPLQTTDRIDAWPLAAFAALLDEPAPKGALPPLWQLMLVQLPVTFLEGGFKS